jgi:choline dehydrogenase-like flavoprotein
MPEERADVLVIGSGPAGAAITKRLTDLGAKVICLEQGDWAKPEEYPSMQPNWELAYVRGRFHRSPNIRKRPEDYPVVAVGMDQSIPEMVNGVGGTIHWSAHFPRMHPSDFRTRSLDGVGDDWPISYQELEPYYDLNDREMGVSGLAGDPANPPRLARPTPPLPMGVMGKTIGRAFDKLDWYWWVSDNAIISQSYDGRGACEMHGKCELGCPMRAKATADVTYWPKALKKGALLKTWARVREITLDWRGRVRGALYYDRNGKLHEQLARVVVVSCNGIGTPRLLLNSKSKFYPDGIANSSGMVGRNLMLHVRRSLPGVFEDRMDSQIGPADFAISQQFYETDLTRGFARGYSFILQRPSGPLQQSYGVPWGSEHHRVMRRRFPHIINVGVCGEDLPEYQNHIDLDPDVKDSFGIPAARLTYNVGENSRKMLEHGARMGRQLLEAAGAIEITDTGFRMNVSHLMGTARMGSNPDNSVVNAWNQAHDAKNLFVVDGSSFTTSGAVNPTSTIGALALRAADGIWNRRQEWT